MSSKRGSSIIARQKLLPLPVPWQVDLSTPFLRYCGGETELPVEITFVAYFGLEEQESQPGSFSGSTHVAVTRMSDIQTGEPRGPFQLVKVSFPPGSPIRVSPSHSDRETLDESAYDWSAVPRFTDVDHAESTWADICRRWKATSLCPDPRAYEVEKSKWVKQGTRPEYV
jgi:hypothetical protein